MQAPTGTVVAAQDDISSKFFVIFDGYVTIHRSGRHLADLGPGDFFGEVGTLHVSPRNASVIATTPLEAGVIMGWDLRKVSEEVPALAAQLENAAVERGSKG